MDLLEVVRQVDTQDSATAAFTAEQAELTTDDFILKKT